MHTNAPKLVQCQIDSGVATLTLDDPSKLNALSKRMIAQLAEQLQLLAQQPGLRAVILTGAGNKAFVGGANIHSMVDLDPVSGRAFISSVHQVCHAIRMLPVPVIARIDGHTLGGGLEIAVSCDLRIASTRSMFAMPEVRLGVPSVIETVLLPGLIGWGRTRMLVYTARSINAKTAYDWGLVEELVDFAELDTAVRRCVEEIMASDVQVIESQKRLVREWESMTIDQAIDYSIDEFENTWRRPEPGQRMRAFVQHLEDRKAVKK